VDPEHPPGHRAGHHRTAGAGRTYLQHEATTHFDAARVDAFLEQGPKAIDFFTRKTCVQFDMPPVFPDYHAEAPGGQPGGRSMVTRPFDGRELGPRIKQLGHAAARADGVRHDAGLGQGDLALHARLQVAGVLRLRGQTADAHALDVLQNGRGMTLTNGNALAGRLAKAAMDLKVPVWLQSPVKDLIVEDGVVRGAWVNARASRTRVRRPARRGAGLRRLPARRGAARAAVSARAHRGEHFTPSPAANTGDGLRLAEAVGGFVDPTIPHAAAWVPTSVTQRPDGSAGVMPHFIDRAKPGVIAVTRRASVSRTKATRTTTSCRRWWRLPGPGRGQLLAAVRPPHAAPVRPGLRGAVPDAAWPPPAHRLPQAWRHAGRSGACHRRRRGHAASHGAALQRTRARGEDPDFGKGSKAYNRYQGDALNQPNPCVAPLETGPFYAIKLVVGDIGTFAGLATDAQTRVLDAQRRPIPGLYAVGNDAASIMGGNYPGAGITLGPALTFGYIAGHQLAQAPETVVARRAPADARGGLT
jgi:hypothetical protein